MAVNSGATGLSSGQHRKQPDKSARSAKAAKGLRPEAAECRL